MNMINYNKAAIVKSRLSMADVLRRYGYEPRPRMKCPLHGGDDLNFAIRGNSFFCFSHCGGGDVISFVQRLFNISFPEALQKIDADFALGLYNKPTLEQSRRIQEAEARQTEAKRKRNQLAADYDSALGKYAAADSVISAERPKSPDEITPELAEALKNKDRLAYYLDEANERIWQDEHGQDC